MGAQDLANRPLQILCFSMREPPADVLHRTKSTTHTKVLGLFRTANRAAEAVMKL